MGLHYGQGEKSLGNLGRSKQLARAILHTD